MVSGGIFDGHGIIVQPLTSKELTVKPVVGMNIEGKVTKVLYALSQGIISLKQCVSNDPLFLF